MADIAELAAYIDRPGIDADPELDIARRFPGISREDALRVQLAVKRRRVDHGDRIIGHQASFTSFALRKLFPDAPLPMVGTLLASLAFADSDQVALDADQSFVECEVAFILKRDLEGPRLTDWEVAAAIDCVLPAIEIAPLRPGVLERAYSYEHMIAVQKAVGGYVIFGERQSALHGLDVALEGCIGSVDGERRSAGVGYEAMRSPIKVVAAMARTLYAVEEKLHAGQIVMTGSLPVPAIVTRDNRSARAEFSRIGSVGVRFR